MLEHKEEKTQLCYQAITVVLFLIVAFANAGAEKWDLSSSIPVPAKIPPSVEDMVSPVSPENVDIQGLLATRINAHINARILKLSERKLLAGFRNRAPSGGWVGEHAGKWLHAACLMWLWSGDPRLGEKIERVATGLMACQEEDGYSGTYTPDKRFGLLRGTNWDVWVHKYTLIGLLSYWGISGDEEALDCCRRIGDLMCQVFPKTKSIIAAGAHVGMAGTSILEPMVLLYRATGEKKYLDFALYVVGSWDERNIFLSGRNIYLENGPRILSAMLKDKTVLAVGNRKAYEMLSNYVGLCELYRATGKKEYLQAAELAWKDVKTKRLYITGGSSSFEIFHPDGHLPNCEASHIQETCVTVTWMQLNWQLLRITGKERYADALEETIFNQLLGAQKPDGSGFGYYVPLVGRKPFASQFYPSIERMHCCNSSGPRGLGLIPTCLGCISTDGFRINMFAPAHWTFEHDGVPVDILLESDFPSSGKGTIVINPQKELEFCLSLRIPDWAATREVQIDGKIFYPEGGTYLKLRRRWKKGDRLTFNFPFRFDMHKGVGTNEGLVAFTAGPLVLAFDKMDNPDVCTPRYVMPAGGSPAEMDLHIIDAPDQSTWKNGRFWEGSFTDLLQKGTFKDLLKKAGPSEFRGVLRPFFTVGLQDSQYAVWIKAPGSSEIPLDKDMVGPFLFEHEFYSNDGNSPGSIADGNPETFRVTFDKSLQEEAYFGILVQKPVSIGRVVYIAGPCFPHGGWFDTSTGKPWIEIKRARNAPWEKIAVLDGYPDTTQTNKGQVKSGMRFSVTFTPVEAVAIRAIGKPSCGKNPNQSFASCAELMGFAK